MATNGNDVCMSRIDGKEFRPVTTVFAMQMNDRFYVETSARRQYGAVGDYLVEDESGHRSVVSREAFEKDYMEA